MVDVAKEEADTSPCEMADPTGATVSANIKRLRGGLSYTEMSRRLQDSAGWSINAVGIRRIESNERRVTVDDLMAFAVAFGVSPATLLIPDSSHGDCEVSATGLTDPIAVEFLWAWITAAQPFPGTASVFDFWSAALPLWLRQRMWEEFEKNKRFMPPSAFLSQPKAEADGND